MSVTTTTTAPHATRRAGSLRRTTVVSGLLAAAVVTGIAAAAHAAGVSFEIESEMIPLLGFTQLTFVGAVIDGIILAVLNRRSVSPVAASSRRP